MLARCGAPALTALAHTLGAKGFVGVDAIAVGIISGADQAIARGELEAVRFT